MAFEARVRRVVREGNSEGIGRPRGMIGHTQRGSLNLGCVILVFQAGQYLFFSINTLVTVARDRSGRAFRRVLSTFFEVPLMLVLGLVQTMRTAID